MQIGDYIYCTHANTRYETHYYRWKLLGQQQLRLQWKGPHLGQEGEGNRTCRVQDEWAGQAVSNASECNICTKGVLLTSGDASAPLNSERQISSRQLIRVHVCSSDSVTCAV